MIRPSFTDLNFNKIGEEENAILTASFTEAEIKDAIWSCDGSKSPGPDGFNINFIKKNWEVMKEDICRFVSDFQKNGRLVKGVNASFLVLIPKKLNPQRIGEYRPISLIGCIYKILSKLLARRLRKIMDRIISEEQSAFIEGRHITDSILVTNEIIDEAVREKKDILAFKVDFEKAFDSVNWDYLDDVMGEMGFCHT